MGFMIFSMLPMSIVTLYHYNKIREILLEQSYTDMNRYIDQVKKNVDSTFERYSVILEILQMDKMFNMYLNKDYTYTDYWEMFSYIDNKLSGLMSRDNAIDRISIFSNNNTLPNDKYYFYPKEEAAKEWFERALQKRGETVIIGPSKRKDKHTIVLGKILNNDYYWDENNLLILEIFEESLAAYIQTIDVNQELYLIDHGGRILSASNQAIIGNNINDVIKEWGGIPEDDRGLSLKVDGEFKINIARSCMLNTKLILIRNQEDLLNEASKVSREIIFIFMVSSVIVFVCIYFYNLWITKRVNQVVFVAKKIGAGHFDYKLNDMGKDEIGIIAQTINRLNDEVEELIKENYEKQLKLKVSEVNLLQEQINPHFLYNALTMISSTAIREGQKETVKSIQCLANFYRLALSKGRQMIMVKEEIDILQNYMKIQQIRFREAVEIRYDMEEEVLQFKTLKLILQPIVENAIHHGRRDNEQVLHIKVTIRLQNDCIVYEVYDDGEGIEEKRLEKIREELNQSTEGYGLKNVDIRIKLNYGEVYGVSVESVYGEGTFIRVVIPQVL